MDRKSQGTVVNFFGRLTTKCAVNFLVVTREYLLKDSEIYTLRFELTALKCVLLLSITLQPSDLKGVTKKSLESYE